MVTVDIKGLTPEFSYTTLCYVEVTVTDVTVTVPDAGWRWSVLSGVRRSTGSSSFLSFSTPSLSPSNTTTSRSSSPAFYVSSSLYRPLNF